MVEVNVRVAFALVLALVLSVCSGVDLARVGSLGVATDASYIIGFENARAAAAGDGAGVWVAAWSQVNQSTSGSDHDVVLARSADDGASWSVASVSSTSADFDYHPSVAVDDSGVFVVTWLARGSIEDAIFFVRSTDGGISWSLPVGLEVAPVLDLNDPSVSGGPGGTFVAVWSGGDADAIHFARSGDSGETWSSAAVLAVTPGSDTQPVVDHDGAGFWVVVWTYEEVDKDIASSQSFDDGASWSGATYVDNPAGTTGTDGDDFRPTLANDKTGNASANANWVVAWEHTDDAAFPTFSHIYAMTLIASGTSGFVGRTTISDNDGSSSPSAACDNFGLCSVVWRRVTGAPDIGRIVQSNLLFDPEASGGLTDWPLAPTQVNNITSDGLSHQGPALSWAAPASWVALWTEAVPGFSSADLTSVEAATGSTTAIPTSSPTAAPSSSPTTSPPTQSSSLSGGEKAGIGLGAAALVCGLVALGYLVHRHKRGSDSGPVTPAGGFLYDVFLTHDWGEDELGRSNHARVSKMNSKLKELGLKTWFDEERMEGRIDHKMMSGIKSSRVIIVFVTELYMLKLQSRTRNNCGKEFGAATRVRTSANMVLVVMEPRMLDQTKWDGPLQLNLGGDLYSNFTDDEALNNTAQELTNRVRGIIAKQEEEEEEVEEKKKKEEEEEEKKEDGQVAPIQIHTEPTD